MTKNSTGIRSSSSQIKCPTCPNTQNSSDIIELKIV